MWGKCPQSIPGGYLETDRKVSRHFFKTTVLLIMPLPGAHEGVSALVNLEHHNHGMNLNVSQEHHTPL